MAGPLVGIRVLDLGRWIACPFCGMLLADLGAEVIRVERPGGSEDRFVGPLSPSGDIYSFANQNRNKKAVTLNFERDHKAREILMDMVKHADVVIENFSPRAAEAMGITYENLKKIKPDIIFAHISSFGPTGPYRNRIGFDQIAKAMSGSMSISGFPDKPAIREVPPHIDYGTASLTTTGVLAALYHRQLTGEGQMIDTALLQTAVTYMAPQIGEWETGKMLRQQFGNRGYWCGPSDLYQTKDGKWVMLSVITNSIWRRFTRFIGREDLATDPKFKEEWDRWEQRDIIDPIVAEWVASKTADELISLSEEVPIPCSICYKHTEVASDPQVKAREMLTELPAHNGQGDVLVTNIPLRMSGTPLKIERSFPAIGEHNEAVYGEILGYGREDLDKLEEEGII